MKNRTDKSDQASIKNLSVLVTGATGFVGSAIAEHCSRSGMKVSLTGRSAGAGSTLPGYITADVTEPQSLNQAMADIDCVVHAAGLAHQFGGEVKPSAFFRTNVRGAENVANSAKLCRVKHLVLISSVAVYGPHGADVCDETTRCNPVDPYAESKLEAENRTIEIIKQSDTNLTILRLVTVYGEGDPGNVARLMRMIDRGRFVWVGDGSNKKSLIHRDDVARACAIVLSQASRGVNIYNVTGSVSTMREIVEALAVALDTGLPRWRIPSGLARTMASSFDRIPIRRKANARFRRTVEKWLGDDAYDGEKFNREFQFSPEIVLRDGLRREVDWHRGVIPKRES